MSALAPCGLQMPVLASKRPQMSPLASGSPLILAPSLQGVHHRPPGLLRIPASLTNLPMLVALPTGLLRTLAITLPTPWC